MAPTSRIPVPVSLHRALRDARPDVRPILASKATLVATSHLIEDLVARASGRHVLMSGFQHARHWAAERDRYLDLAGDSEVIAVFAGREPPPGWHVDHVGVRLNEGDPLTQEWFVLALGPDVAVTLCGLDRDAGAETEDADGARLFEVIWSFDRSLAEQAAAIVVRALAEVAPDAADRARHAVQTLDEPQHPEVAVTREADQLLAGLLDRVELLRGRERTIERRANEAKTEFLSRMSHELRTPLNAILGFTQLLELEGGRSEEDRESLGHISRAGRHLLQLIDEVLDISRIETGRLALALETVRVNEAVEEALALIRPLAEQKGIAIEEPWRTAAALGAHADRQRLVQILLNLFSNGVKYNARNGRLGVEAIRGDANTVRIAVSDTGPGISAEERHRLFVPFERLPATAGTTEGTGLGLALSLRMAQAMGGRIDVDSRPGHGSTFTLVLPAADVEARAADAARRPAPAHLLLYIEDNPSNLRLVERVLARRADVELLTATRAEEGLAIARERLPDLILLDLNLPDRPGQDVLAALRQSEATGDIPVVVISSDAAPGVTERIRASGAAAYLTKPLDLTRLLDTLDAVLDGRLT